VHLRDASGTDRVIVDVGRDLVPSDVEFSPDGRLLAVPFRAEVGAGSHGLVIVWDVHERRERARLDTGEQMPWELTFSPDGTRLVAATSQTTIGETVRHESRLRIWRTEDLSELPGQTREGSWLASLAVGRDGTLAVTWSDGTVELRRLDDGKVLRTLKHPFTVRQLVFSPDSRTLATATTQDEVIRLWDTGTGEKLAELAGHLDSLNSLAFSPDSRRLLSAGADGQTGVWQLDPNAVVAELCQLRRARNDTDLPPLCQT
jgi:WD40 repeat protein